jgi:hypothetical protein
LPIDGVAENGGSHGIDRETFADIETAGIKEWLGKLKKELSDPKSQWKGNASIKYRVHKR